MKCRSRYCRWASQKRSAGVGGLVLHDVDEQVVPVDGVAALLKAEQIVGVGVVKALAHHVLQPGIIFAITDVAEYHGYGLLVF